MNNSDNAIRNTIIEVFGVANDDVFLNAGLSLSGASQNASLCAKQIQGGSVLSILGASCDGVRILSSINANLSTLEALFPNGKASADELRDWCGELNNQLVGAAKNQMLAYECKMMMGIPTLIQGENLANVHAAETFVSKRTYVCDAGEIITYLSTQVSPKFIMRDEPDLSLTGIAVGGELSFF